MSEHENQEAIELAKSQVKEELEEKQAERVAQERAEKTKDSEEMIDFAKQNRIVGRRS